MAFYEDLESRFYSNEIRRSDEAVKTGQHYREGCFRLKNKSLGKILLHQILKM